MQPTHVNKIHKKPFFIIQSISDPVNENFMEVMIMIDALRRASAGTINVVIPYYGYARSDRKARSREPITAKLLANFIQMAGADRVVAMDLHAGQLQGFFNIPVDHLLAIFVQAQYFGDLGLKKDVVVVAPEEYTGAVMGDITSRRGRPLGQESRGNAIAFEAMVPLAEMFGYATSLRSNTQGRGNFTMVLDHYEEVPKSIAEDIIKKNGGN